jgi:hypothetical protein
MAIIDENEIIAYVAKNFYKTTSSLLGFFIILFLYVPLNGFISEIIPSLILRLTFIVFLFNLWYFFWLYKKYYLPQIKKGNIGIVVCIQAENDVQRSRLKEDFADRLKNSIKNNNLESSIEVLVLGEHESMMMAAYLSDYSHLLNEKKPLQDKLKDPRNKKWVSVQKKVNGKFYIWGKIKERLDPNVKYILNIDALAIHREVQREVSDAFKKDILAVWYNSYSFAKEIEIKGFDLTADMIYIAVKYVVGIAALVSGDPETAIKLHEKLQVDFSNFNPLPKNLEYVQTNLKSLLTVEWLIKARLSYLNGDLMNARECLKESVGYLSNNYGAYILESIINFGENKIDEAIISVMNAQKYAGIDGTWRYNLAFLLMCKGHFKKAYKEYKAILTSSYPWEEKTLLEIYGFNEQYFKLTQSRFSLFIIGYLKYFKSSNCSQAYSYFDKFIKSISPADAQYKFLLTKAIAFKGMAETAMDGITPSTEL